ncbi:MAG TPA: hypothetical protein PL188_02865 [Candidatus Cloacimonadota bacterium]|nr:hypothetical protein [Candidatus Cloacimonadota bacterium]
MERWKGETRSAHGAHSIHLVNLRSICLCYLQEIPDSPASAAHRLTFWNDGVRVRRFQTAQPVLRTA